MEKGCDIETCFLLKLGVYLARGCMKTLVHLVETRPENGQAHLVGRRLSCRCWWYNATHN